jgi:hypothetical protein
MGEYFDSDPALGRLHFDADEQEWCGTMTHRDVVFPFHLKQDPASGFTKSHDRAARFANEIRLEMEAIGFYVAGCLIDLARAWEAAGEGIWEMTPRRDMSVERFLDRIKPARFTFHGDGGLEFVFEDETLFAGHWIVGRMRADNVLVKAGLEG